MKSPYVSELEPNQTVQATFLVHSKDVRQKKSGDCYLSLLLADRTGELDAKMWDNVADVMETFARNDFVRVKGLLQIHQNRLQLTVHKMQKVDEREVDFSDYFPASRRDPGEMFAEFGREIAAVANPHLKALIEAVFADEEIASRFRAAPAGKQIHHAYLGGLLEHVLSLCRLARLAAGHYPDIDVDLLIAGALLHDLGKIHELTYERSFGYSDEGQLLGHIVIGLRLIDEKLRALPGFPPRLATLVEHLIVSHHGAPEFGSPRTPMLPEALLLHHLDNLDSKMENMRALLEKDSLVAGCWTAYSPAIERSVLKKERYLNPDPPAVPSSPPSTPARGHSEFADKLLGAIREES